MAEYIMGEKIGTFKNRKLIIFAHRSEAKIDEIQMQVRLGLHRAFLEGIRLGAYLMQ